MIFKNIKSVDKIPVEMDGAKNVVKQLVIGREDGTPVMSFRVFSLGPEGHTPYHRHPYEHINYVIEGEGAVVDEDGNEQSIKRGDFVLVLPNEKHRYRNTHYAENFVMICAVKKEFE